ncbi:ankyrin [Byssothecium circinans]|uniref:Ankyrin n=1 Tax=Byssothecium circinans TaxID=147558 RepID=A0A6A5U056_9PLEO|nr:ankyrin [Byssothecium circinans]
MGYKCLWSAVYGEDISEVRRLLRDRKTDRNEESNGWTPIILAARNGNEKIMQMLIADKDVNIDAVSLKGRTAVFEAAQKRHWHLLRVLVCHRALTYIATEDKETALQYAVRNGERMITSLLLNNGAHKTILQQESNRDDTVLHLAVRNGSLFLCGKLASAAYGSPMMKLMDNGFGETAKALAVRLKRSAEIIAAVS